MGLRAVVMACLLVPSCTPAPRAAHPPEELSYRRIYRPGEMDRYELRRTSSINGAPGEVATATSVHEVVGPPPLRERIHFEKLVVTVAGKDQDRTPVLAAVPPYVVSIAPDAPKGALDLPALQGLDGSAVGMITDLHTFLVAVSPQAGIGSLRRAGDVHALPEPRRGAWPTGEDCIQISQKLVELSADTATIETTFEPPATACLTPRAPWMAAPVSDGAGPNNFQQVRKSDDGFSPMWGRERFVVQAVVRRDDGRVLRASMENELVLRTRIKCDETLETCAAEAPVTLRRTLELRAL